MTSLFSLCQLLALSQYAMLLAMHYLLLCLRSWQDKCQAQVRSLLIKIFQKERQ
uniref:Uncharacterized protein n=1 Tax=Arundo donax TaxID=35708 RepID=A0A0A9BRS8_ARUDO